MKKNYFYVCILMCTAFFTSITVIAQNGICGSNPINTEHTITLNNPITPILPVPGTYNLTVKYVDIFSGVPVDAEGYNATLTSTVAQVASSTSQIMITDPSLTFPTIGNDFFDFLDTKGKVQFSVGSTNFFWYWDHDQITCVPLPVELISFSSQQYTSTSIKLVWQTADEFNLTSYVVERSSSLAGSCFVPIGQVTPYNTSGIHNYQFIDNAPYHNNNLYRLKTVNIDGKVKYSWIVSRNCTSCTANPPAVNCSQVSISGPSSLCTSAIYSLTGVTSCGGATWSISPSYLGTVVPNYFNSLNAKVTRSNSGTATISATIPGCPNAFTKTVTMGAPSLTTTTNIYKTQAYTRYTVSVYNPTAGYYDYLWYSDGDFVGPGYSHDFYVYANSTGIYYNVNLSTACGTASAYGYLEYQIPTGGGGCPELPFTVKQAKGSGTIEMYKPICPIYPAVAEKNTTVKTIHVSDKYQVRLLDFQGTTKREVNQVSLKTIYNFDIRGIIPGNYIVQIINQGVVEYTKKIRID